MDWKARLFVEHEEVCDRLKKLEMFIQTPQFRQLDEVDQALLLKQENVMNQYEIVLNKRVRRIKNMGSE